MTNMEDYKKKYKEALVESEQTELPNGEDYGIDSLYHAARILEKTLGEVEGYQSDDGILEHKCAIEAVKRLCKKNPAWSEEDENMLKSIIATCELAAQDRVSSPARHLFEMQTNWLKSFKDRIISFIGTLEVKEVDLEEEFNNFLDNVEGVPRMWHSDEQIEWGKDIAKYFFELGLKTQKGE